MSQTYTQRQATVVDALEAQKIKPAGGKSIIDVADSVLSALDHIKETVR